MYRLIVNSFIVFAVIGLLNPSVYSQSTESSIQESSSITSESAFSSIIPPKNNCIEVSSELNDEYIRLLSVSQKYTQGVKSFNVQAVDLIKILDGAGTDTAQLQEAIVLLETSIFDFENKNNNHLNSLNRLSSEVCLIDKEQYDEKYLALINERKDLRESGIVLENIVKDDIKEVLNDIRGQYALN